MGQCSFSCKLIHTRTSIAEPLRAVFLGHRSCNRKHGAKKKKKTAAVSIPDGKRITVHRESNHNLQHGGRL